MASPVLHVKDSYYFEVPKMFWTRSYESFDDVPESLQFLHESHPSVGIEQFNHELSGKIILAPQPFGELKNLYEAESGFCVSKFMIVELIVAVLVAGVFIWLANRGKKISRPTGRRHNMLEAFVGYVRDEVARPAIGHGADRFVPYLLTVFFFILACNLIGMVPGMGTVTSSIEVTSILALFTLLIGVGAGIQNFGAPGYLMHFMPDIGDSVLMLPIKILIWAIELLGLLIKHAVLAIRLFGNMVAGHMVLAGILGTVVAVAGTGWWGMGAFFGVIGATALSALEILVCFIQAYVFTMLSALFIGMSIHDH